MSILELIILSIGLSMDAFAVSICKGLSLSSQKPKFKHLLICGIWFGFFQALMPLIGFSISNKFSSFVDKYSHIIAFIILAILGVKMIKESLENNENEEIDSSFGVKSMFILAVATSIDALAVGVSFAMLNNINIFISVSIIGIITFLFSCIGVKIGNVFGIKYKKKAETLGGIILIFIGIKILLT